MNEKIIDRICNWKESFIIVTYLLLVIQLKRAEYLRKEGKIYVFTK